MQHREKFGFIWLIQLYSLAKPFCDCGFPFIWNRSRSSLLLLFFQLFFFLFLSFGFFLNRYSQLRLWGYVCVLFVSWWVAQREICDTFFSNSNLYCHRQLAAVHPKKLFSQWKQKVNFSASNRNFRATLWANPLSTLYSAVATAT
jgi:hypothetical protein